MKDIPTAQEILDNEDMRALAAMGAMSLGRIDLCVALLHNRVKIKNLNEEASDPSLPRTGRMKP